MSNNYAVLDGSGNPLTKASTDVGAGVQADQVDLVRVGGSAVALGQALAAASLPVVLTAAQVTTLTPPAAITGFSTETTLAALNTKVTACNTGAVVLAAGSATFGNVTQSDPAATTGSITAADAATVTTATTSGQSFLTGAPTANSSVSATLSGHASAAIEITNTWVGTLEVDESCDGGTTWVQRGVYVSGTPVNVTTITTNGLFQGNAGNLTNLRVRCTAYISGTVTVRIQPGYGLGHPRTVSAVGGAASGSAVAGNPVLVAGSDGTNARTLLMDATGNAAVNVAKMNGVATSMGNGTTDTGTQRVTLSSDGTGQVIALGNVASGVTDAGNPLKIGGKISTSVPAAGTNANRADAYFDARGRLGVVLGAGAADAATTQSNSDAQAVNIGLCVVPQAQRYNGSTWDRDRNNTDLSGLASAARTANVNTPDQTNYNGRGCKVVVSITAVTTGTLTFTIKAKDSISGSYYTLLASAAQAGTGVVVLTVYPGVAVAANVSANDVLPRTWRVEVSGSDASIWTYSVSCVTIL